MFTLQIPDLVRQIRGQIPDQAVNAFESILGNCSANLEHRGPIRVEIDGNYMPDLPPGPRGGPLTENCDGTATAAITAINRAGEWVGENCKSDCVKGGLALRAIGPSQLDSARIDTLYVGSLADLCGNPLSVISASDTLLRFVVTDDDPTGGNGKTAFGRILTWDGFNYVQTGPTIALLDFTVTNEFARRWRNGYQGWCCVQSDRLTITVNSVEYPVREVVWVESKVRFIEFQTTTLVASQLATADVLFAWGSDDRADVDATVTIFDRPNHMSAAPIGFKGIAVWDEVARAYIPLNTFGTIDPNVGAPPAQLANITITNGLANGSCLYEGKITEYGPVGVPDFCTGDVWNTTTDVWVFAPNITDILMPIRTGQIHFGEEIDPAFDLGGDVRPLYVCKDIQENPFVCLRFQNSTRRSDCTYPADVVTSSGSDFCEQTDVVQEADVLAYLPNASDDCTFIEGPLYSWGLLIKNDYMGKPLYLSKMDLHNCRALFAIVQLDAPLDCADLEGTAVYVQFIKHGEHKQAWGPISSQMTFSNRFKLCGESGKLALVMLNEDGLEKHLLIQVEHTCVDVIVGLTPNPPCNITVSKWTTAVMKKSEAETELNLEDAICGCCG